MAAVRVARAKAGAPTASSAMAKETGNSAAADGAFAVLGVAAMEKIAAEEYDESATIVTANAAEMIRPQKAAIAIATIGEMTNVQSVCLDRALLATVAWTRPAMLVDSCSKMIRMAT